MGVMAISVSIAAAPTFVTSDSSALASLADQIDALLPQTQCTRCGFSACRPYADALARGTTGLNRCPPGGAELIAVLAMLTGQEPKPLAPECGETVPLRVAVIAQNTHAARKGRDYELPFGAFLAAGSLLVIYFGSPVLNWYQSLLYGR